MIKEDINKVTLICQNIYNEALDRLIKPAKRASRTPGWGGVRGGWLVMHGLVEAYSTTGSVPLSVNAIGDTWDMLGICNVVEEELLLGPFPFES